MPIFNKYFYKEHIREQKLLKHFLTSFFGPSWPWINSCPASTTGKRVLLRGNFPPEPFYSLYCPSMKRMRRNNMDLSEGKEPSMWSSLFRGDTIAQSRRDQAQDVARWQKLYRDGWGENWTRQRPSSHRYLGAMDRERQKHSTVSVRKLWIRFTGSGEQENKAWTVKLSP